MTCHNQVIVTHITELMHFLQ